MRKITSNAIAAFQSGKNFKDGATQVNRRIGGMELVLHGHVIAKNIDGEGLSINLSLRVEHPDNAGTSQRAS